MYVAPSFILPLNNFFLIENKRISVVSIQLSALTKTDDYRYVCFMRLVVVMSTVKNRPITAVQCFSRHGGRHAKSAVTQSRPSADANFS